MASMFDRIKALLPKGWFPDDTPVLDALLAGLASGLEHVKSLYDYVVLQTRIRTATGGWLDLIGADFFGNKLQRKPNQSDESYRAEILANLFLEKTTRKAIHDVIVALTGQEPVIVEPTRPLDTGAYGVPTSGYGVAGAYGSVSCPYQMFVTVYRPKGTGVPFIGGWGINVGGYSTPGQIEYAPSAVVLSSIVDADILRAIDTTKAAGTVVWVRIGDSVETFQLQATRPLLLDGTWQLDGTYRLNGVKAE